MVGSYMEDDVTNCETLYVIQGYQLLDAIGNMNLSTVGPRK